MQKALFKPAGAKELNMPGKLKIILICAISVSGVLLLIGGAFTALGYYVNRNDEIMPNIHVDGINVSGLTYEETLSILAVNENERLMKKVSVTVRLPDGSELNITGEDINLRTDVREKIDEAFNIGRGNGFFARKSPPALMFPRCRLRRRSFFRRWCT